MNDKRHNFKAKIYKVGINCCVDVSSEITSKMTVNKGFIKIKGTINDFAFKNKLVPIKNKLTEENYGSVPRYYIECTKDRAITSWLQEKMLADMPCLKVYKLPSSHSPFFSMPYKLTDIICEIANL